MLVLYSSNSLSVGGRSLSDLAKLVSPARGERREARGEMREESGERREARGERNTESLYRERSRFTANVFCPTPPRRAHLPTFL